MIRIESLLERLNWWYGLADPIPEAQDGEGVWLREGERRYLLLGESSTHAVMWRIETIRALEYEGLCALPRPLAVPGGAPWVELEGHVYSLWMPGEPGARPQRDGRSLAEFTRILGRVLVRKPLKDRYPVRYGTWVASFRRSLSLLHPVRDAGTGADPDVLAAFFEEGERAMEMLAESGYRAWSERARERQLACCGRWRAEAVDRLWEDPGFLRRVVGDLPLYDVATMAENLMADREEAEMESFLTALWERWTRDGWSPGDLRTAWRIIAAYLRFPHRWPLARTDLGGLDRYADAWFKGLRRLQNMESALW
ncbi:MAG: hypothetical protein QJR01_02220 [Kyrpidia sp.]|nr:hypothetical protein [Kyrpidia sp.]